ncbi:MAG: arylformamidase [Thermotogota bacterium]|nr:arylformamidase [Thermotogota bacterium]MDK2863946.1 arylformamidase [Thermotogota bacterium]
MARFVDLTLTLEHGTRALDLDPITFINKYRTIEKDGYNLSQVILSSHVATHIDVPRHFLENGETLEQIPLDRLIGEACLLDFSHKKAKERITADELSKYDNLIEPDSVVILRTDWYKTFPSHEYGYDNPNVTTDAVEYLVSKKIKMLGVEAPTLNWEDNPRSHKILLGAGIILVEGLAYLDQLETDTFRFYAIPLKIKGLDGFPVRAFAEIL